MVGVHPAISFRILGTVALKPLSANVRPVHAGCFTVDSQHNAGVGARHVGALPAPCAAGLPLGQGPPICETPRPGALAQGAASSKRAHHVLVRNAPSPRKATVAWGFSGYVEYGVLWVNHHDWWPQGADHSGPS